MKLINRSLCSKEFNAAYDALEQGRAVRRKHWPTGQYLEKQPNGLVCVVRHGCIYAPPWAGPSNEESDGTDWEVVGNGFNPRKLHTYTEAKVGGKWFDVSHFALDLGMVWLKPGHGIMSGFVDIVGVEEWKGVTE